jgi:hypothetical protein
LRSDEFYFAVVNIQKALKKLDKYRNITFKTPDEELFVLLPNDLTEQILAN